MPLEVMKNIIGIIGEEYTIYDPFMGSGTTGVACAIMERKFIGSEINIDYCKLAEKRIKETEINNTKKRIDSFVGGKHD